MIRFYGYDKCSTCRKAKQRLAQLGLQFEDIDITTSPPPKAVLEKILSAGGYELPDLLNRSGVQYRELNMKEQVKTLSRAQLLSMLADNGRLCRRPIVTDGVKHTVGYDAPLFEATWGAASKR